VCEFNQFSVLEYLFFCLDDWGLIPSRGRDVSRLHNIHINSGAHWASIQCLLGVKQLKCKAHYSLPSSAKVKNAWRFTSTSIYM